MNTKFVVPGVDDEEEGTLEAFTNVVDFFSGYAYFRHRRPIGLSFCSLLMYFLSCIAHPRYMSLHTSLFMIQQRCFLLLRWAPCEEKLLLERG